MKIYFTILISFLLFSFWALFALFVINDSFHQNVPGYKIGQLCVWEYIAFPLSVILSVLMIRKWGLPRLKDGQFMMSYNYAWLFTFYVIYVLGIAAWKFYVFIKIYGA
ncbi:MAG: hypothetical protein MRY83_22830 [Flavobacteriales bacterium]|nr:hypothetical protein [Flavobacteriales bacterium]